MRVALGSSKEQAQQDTRRTSVSVSTSPPDPANTPATPGADSAPDQGGRGPSLPARPASKKKGRATMDPQVTLRTADEDDGSSLLSAAPPNSSQAEGLKGNGSQGKSLGDGAVLHERSKVVKKKAEPEAGAKPAMRQLKLIFGHDIRRAEIPINCG